MSSRALFITTKNLDYLRNTQEIRILKERYDQVDVIGSSSSSYPKRLLKVYGKLLVTRCRWYDEVFVGFSPQLIVPFFSFKFRKTKLTIDFFISVYDTMVCDRKKFKEKSLPARFSHWLDRRTLRKADSVISDTNAHGDYFSEEFGIKRKKIRTLYLEADTSYYYPRPQKKPSELADRFVVLYFGSILPVQGVDVIMDALRPLMNRKEYYFVIVGPMKEEIRKAEGDNIEYVPWLPQDQLAEKIAQADLCLAGHFNAENGKAQRTIPGKAYIYDAMKKPMILGDSPANRELYPEKPGVYEYVPMGDPGALTGKIQELSERKYG